LVVAKAVLAVAKAAVLVVAVVVLAAVRVAVVVALATHLEVTRPVQSFDPIQLVAPST
jgi:hypothetical protein